MRCANPCVAEAALFVFVFSALALPRIHAQPPSDAPAPPGASSEIPPLADEPIAVRIQALYDAGDDLGAIRLADNYLVSHPKETDARLGAARSLARLGASSDKPPVAADYYRRALEHLETARVAEPRRIDVRIGVCDVFYHLRRHDPLLSEIKSLLDDHPESAQARDGVRFYGEKYLQDGDAVHAAAVYELLIRAWPELADLASDYGTALIVSGKLDEGRAALERAARLDPADADVLHNLGQACLYGSDTKAAVGWFQKAYEAKPDFGRFALDLAVAQAITEPDKAVPLFEKAESILGVADLQKILVHKLRIGMTSPKLKPVDLERLASDLQEAGYPVYAFAAAEKALRADPKLVHTVLLRAQIADQMRFYERSIEQFRRVRSLADGLPAAERPRVLHEATLGEAKALVGLGEPQKALELLTSAGPEDYPFQMADALAALGEMERARKILENIASRGTDPDTAAIALQRLKELAEAQRRQ